MLFRSVATRPGGTPATKQAAAPAALTKGIVMKGGEMVLVEAGDFLIGQNKAHDTLPAFYIDKTEVSNAAYARFCPETKHALPKGFATDRSEEHTSELQSLRHLVCRLLL